MEAKKKQEAKTTLVYRGVEYPFYKTNRGQWNFENAGFSNEGLLKGNLRDTLALAYFTVQECAKRANKSFADSLDDFIDFSDPDITDVFIRLKNEKDRIEKELKLGKQEPPKMDNPSDQNVPTNH